MKRNESKTFYETYTRPMLPIGYFLDKVVERELQDVRNNTKFIQMPCWHAEQVKLSKISENYIMNLWIQFRDNSMMISSFQEMKLNYLILL